MLFLLRQEKYKYAFLPFNIKEQAAQVVAIRSDTLYGCNLNLKGLIG